MDSAGRVCKRTGGEVARFCGIYIAVWSGIESALSWMPRNWVNIDEDGNREWMAKGIGGSIGSSWLYIAFHNGSFANDRAWHSNVGTQTNVALLPLDAAARISPESIRPPERGRHRSQYRALAPRPH
jgi:hypothetical protein